ncbi:CPBP family intramembrane glutamic endopeptidase [Metabacillus arenae]|uniref:CPBP family intramembrane metalloprotease n=1 Tax=Metabacillus arenae TaxID=2771434 RepID=A0A926NSL2_9BACI|nr:type II CAAX endopeptidase family protein [Metabacillus arenae]MBD1383151.1 CPBP family intramembrane metalloprotease [Metabacillus arenae]
MKKQYWFVILTYIFMQFSGIAGAPLLVSLGVGAGEPKREALIAASGYWAVISFTVALIIILLLMRKDFNETLMREKPASIGMSIVWSIAGVFMALFVQGIAANIETNLFGVDPGSENTQMIVEVIQVTPLLMVVTSIIGPILEELIFRKILFGVIYQRTNFFIAGLISSVIFAIVHGEPEHLLLYSAMGFTFAYLYVKTKRIIVPIFAHVAMNTFVVVIQVVFREDIDKIMKQYEQMQAIIGGF